MKSDDQVKLEVLAELQAEPAVNGAQVGVMVKDGVVTLAGHLGSYAEKWHAEQAAQRVAGVKALVLQIDVALQGESVRGDADIALAAANVLQWTTNMPKDSIKVAVEGGWVSLSGEVDGEYQRQAAAGAVRYLMGVTGVTNRIAIKPKVSAMAIKADIEAALKRHAHGEAHTISVDAQGSDVTLTGTVRNWSERELARHAAWSTPGVRNVMDNMTVAL